jgi:hypothetical protein
MAAASLGWAKLWPHSPQNFLPKGISAPHAGHFNSILVPHSSQNFIPSRLSNWHFRHFIIDAFAV